MVCSKLRVCGLVVVSWVVGPPSVVFFQQVSLSNPLNIAQTGLPIMATVSIEDVVWTNGLMGFTSSSFSSTSFTVIIYRSLSAEGLVVVLDTMDCMCLETDCKCHDHAYTHSIIFVIKDCQTVFASCVITLAKEFHTFFLNHILGFVCISAAI